MDTVRRACGIKALLVSNLSAASLAHAQRTAALSGLAGTADFSEGKTICEKLQRQYDACWDALKAHQEKHHC
jgi:hypothetical protein